MDAPLGTPAPRRGRTPRLTALACSVALLATTLGAAPAQAAPAEGFATASSGVFGDSDATGERCEIDAATPQSSDEVTGDGRTVRVSDSRTRTATSPVDAADTTTFSFRSSAAASVRQTGGVVRSFVVDATTTTRAESSRGGAADCDFEGLSRGGAFFTGPFRAGFLRLDLRLSGRGGAVSALVDGPGLADSAFLTSSNGELTYDVRLGTGDHRIDVALDAAVMRPETGSSAVSLTSDASVRVRGLTTGLGGAWGRATGSGRSQVGLPAARSCPSGTVRVQLKRPTRNARKVVLLLDGKRRATVKRPKPGRAVVVRRARAGAGVTVSAAITRASGKVLTTSREYAACR
jgi:hypothetical protein